MSTRPQAGSDRPATMIEETPVTTSTTDERTSSKLETALANLFASAQISSPLMGDVHIHQAAELARADFTVGEEAHAPATTPATAGADRGDLKAYWLEHAGHVVEMFLDSHEDGHRCAATEEVDLISLHLEVASELDLTRSETAILLSHVALKGQVAAHAEGEAVGINDTLEQAFEVAVTPDHTGAPLTVVDFPGALVAAVLGKKAAFEWMLAALDEFPQCVVDEAVAEVLGENR